MTNQLHRQLVLQSFKSGWIESWDEKRNELAQEGEFTSTGWLENPGKYLYLKLL